MRLASFRHSDAPKIGAVVDGGIVDLSARSNAALMLLALGIYLSVINQAPTNAYFAQTLQAWEQGRFIRFHGLIQWLGWLWPYALLLHLVRRLSVPLGRD